MTLEVLAVIAGSAFWCLLGFSVGYEHGHRDGTRDTWEEVARADQAAADLAAKLVRPLACPVCRAPRSNAEISNGWCANCGVYSDGTP